ncbi:exodeoxyribonuclease VII large subunit [Oecophyllibacter saccharovorans]|uniref:Exodeoxyribonuclease 7 large subunit n=2 Tax=Oecophyllibacter saccharovorans TaxID=2558360 RepID=A0A506UMQ6_9PROT|nr:exodeoxyribonuclease VII large subunit [Oecophyllibacter saccharovorans]
MSQDPDDDLIFTADETAAPAQAKATPGPAARPRAPAARASAARPPTNSAPTNVPEFSVSDISGSIKRLLEGAFGRVRVRGEITELKRYPSGHVYLSLKDEGGKIAGVIWRSAVPRLGMVPENGAEIIATGRITTYGERSSYQLVIERLEYAGEGAMLARIEQLRQKLLAEGLFAPERKRPLPFLPRRIGVITSRAGAVLHDICTTISRRFPHEVLLWPVAVQGEGAAPQIAAAIEGMNRLAEPPDVLIVARGGGSLEDLMAFNDERVVRAAAASKIPLISAVGHETDTTLIDFASDRRAPTPTAAAELAVPVRAELQADLDHRAARLSGALAGTLRSARQHLESYRLPSLPVLLETNRMRLEDRAQRLELGLPAALQRARSRLETASLQLRAPELILAPRQKALDAAGSALNAAWERSLAGRQMLLLRQNLSPDLLASRVQLQRARLEGLGRQLEALSPRQVLERGYVLVQDAQGRPVTRQAQLPPHSRVTLDFVDGKRLAELDPEEHPWPPPRRPRERGAPLPRLQGDLGI